MADTHSKSRISLENRFEAGDIPEERHFTELIHSCFNQLDDGIKKDEGSPLRIQAPVNDNGIIKEVIQLFTAFPDQGGEKAEWRIGLASVADSIPKEGLTFSDGEQVGNIRLFIQEDGNIGVGKTNPERKLDVAGTMRAINIEGIINPDNGEETGIEFPSITVDPKIKGASIRYFSRGTSGNGNSLKIEAQEFTNDHIILFPTGNVGIGRDTPDHKLHVEGNAKIEENLTVGAGVSTFNGRLEVNETGSFAGLLEVDGTGTSSFADLLHVKGTGNSKFDGSLDVGKELTVGAGDSSVAGQLNVKGSSIFEDNLEIKKGLTVGASDSSIGGKLTVTGSSIFEDNLEIKKGLTVLGTCSFEGGFEATGDAASSFGGNLNVTGQGASTFAGHLEVKGRGTSSFTEGVEIGEQLTVGAGASSIAGELTVTGSSVFENNLEVKKGLTVGTGVSSFSGDLLINGTGTTTIENTLKVKGTTTFAKPLGVGKDAVTLGVQLDVDGKVQATSMKCTGDINVGKLTSGKTEISDGAIKIDGVEIKKKHLEILRKLESNTLLVKIVSSSTGFVLENYKSRHGDGDANRSIQFNPSNKKRGDSEVKMKLVLV